MSVRAHERGGCYPQNRQETDKLRKELETFQGHSPSKLLSPARPYPIKFQEPSSSNKQTKTERK